MFGLFKDKPEKCDPIGEPLVNALRCYLGDEGISFFEKIYGNSGTLNAVEWHGNYPHAIHFREGMQIRNWMRTYHEAKGIADWDAHDYDNRWEEATLRACRIKFDCPEVEKRR
jgi:hypothetical protein